MASRSQKPLLVIGGGGGLGAVVVEEALAQGLEVRAIDSVGQPRDRGLPISVGQGSLQDEQFLVQSLRGAAAVVHAVSDRRHHASYDALAPLNLDLPTRLFQLANQAGVDRFVFVTSVRVCEPSPKFLEEGAPLGAESDYEQVLQDAEIQLRGLANRVGATTQLMVLRAAPTYGYPGPPIGSPWLAIPPVLDLLFDLIPGVSGGPRMHWVHVRDVARAALHLSQLDVDGPIVTYHVADDSPVTVGEYLNVLIEAYGYPLGVKVPFGPIAVALRLISAIDRQILTKRLDRLLVRAWETVRERHHLPDRFEPTLTSENLSYLSREIIVSNKQLKETGFRLSVPDIREGLRTTIADYQASGYLPRAGGPAPEVEERQPRLRTVFSEVMRGDYRRVVGSPADHAMKLTARLSAPGVRLPFREHVWQLDGRLTMEGFVEDVPVRGTLDISARNRRELVYDAGFAVDGVPHRFHGVKRLRLRHPIESLTRMTVRVYDGQGREVAVGGLEFDLERDLLGFLRSFRLKRAATADDGVV